MEWTFQKYHERGYMLTVLTGEISGQGLQGHNAEALRIQREDGLLRTLVDVRSLIIPPEFSFFELLSVPATQWLEENAERDARAAVIASDDPRLREAVDFYETAAVNRGWIVRAFTDYDEALAWLLEEAETEGD